VLFACPVEPGSLPGCSTGVLFVVAVFVFFIISEIRVIRGSLFLFPGYRLYLRQEIPEFPIVYLYTIVQVKTDFM